MRSVDGSWSSATESSPRPALDSASVSGWAPRRAIDRVVDVVETGRAPAATPLDERVRRVGRDPVQPRRERGVPTEPVDALPGSEVGLLHHVARILLVPGQPDGEGVGVDVRAAHELVERRLVPPPCVGNELLEPARRPVVLVVGSHMTPETVRGYPRVRPAAAGPGQTPAVKFGIFHEHQVPRPGRTGTSGGCFEEALEQGELADRIGIDGFWLVEHHFLEEYSHSSAPEVFLGGAVAAHEADPPRARDRADAAVVQPSRPESPSASRRSTSCRAGGSTSAPASRRRRWSSAGSGSIPSRQARDVGGGAARRAAVPRPRRRSPGTSGEHVSMPPRNVVPKPIQRPHPPGVGGVQPARDDPPRRAARHRRARVRVLRPRGGEVLGRRLLLDARARGRADRRRGERRDRVRHAVHVPSATRSRRSLRAAEGVNFFGYSLGHYYIFGRHHPGSTDVWAEYVERRRELGFDPEAVAAAAASGERLGAKVDPGQLRRPARRDGDTRAGADVPAPIRGVRRRHGHPLERGGQEPPRARDGEPRAVREGGPPRVRRARGEAPARQGSSARAR